MVDLGTYISKKLNIGKTKPKELFTDAYVKEVYELEHVRTATKRLRIILDAKYEKADLHKVMENQCQHLMMTQRNDLLKLLHKFEELFDGKLGTGKTYPVDFELKKDTRQYARDHTQYQRYKRKYSKMRLKV